MDETKREQKFDLVCVLGMGKLAIECIKLLMASGGVKICLYDVNIKKSLYLESFADNNQILYFHLSKEEIFKQLEIISVPTLLCSIVNPYIFPDKILSNKNITAINMHHALLPKHPGRNSEAWAIYEQDKCAGITWHFISSIVDGGPIIAQEGIELTEEITAYRLFELQDKLAIQAFKGFYKKLLNGNVEGKANESGKYSVHLSKDRPNEGFLNLDWNGEKISAFLRSMDYGPLNTLGKPMIYYENVLYVIKKYKISKKTVENSILQIGDTLLINKDSYSFRLICVPANDT